MRARQLSLTTIPEASFDSLEIHGERGLRERMRRTKLGPVAIIRVTDTWE